MTSRLDSVEFILRPFQTLSPFFLNWNNLSFVREHALEYALEKATPSILRTFTRTELFQFGLSMDSNKQTIMERTPKTGVAGRGRRESYMQPIYAMYYMDI